jgi:nicotinate-nucleotide--dimethylbenzimidazole phosphoribosyltransferase
MERLEQIRSQIRPLDLEAQRMARRHVDNLTKPLGSLGRLEEIVVRLAGITGEKVPDIARKAVLVMCGDHGVAEEGVSAYPQEVTGLMIGNFSRGGAAINVLARRAGAEVVVVDLGSKLDEVPPGVIDCRVRRGTSNMAVGPAMTREEALQAVWVGIDRVMEMRKRGVRMIAIGEMGIGNTTAGTAIAAAFIGQPVEELTGRGTGIDDRSLVHKQAIIRKALEVNRPDPADPFDVLAKVGGLEIAGMSGAVLGAAAVGLPVVVDGLISTAAALVAAKWEPRVREYLFASHMSVEPAHRIMLDELGLAPLIDARMRLGEGSGAALCFPLFDAAVSVAREMATFADLGLEGPAARETEGS